MLLRSLFLSALLAFAGLAQATGDTVEDPPKEEPPPSEKLQGCTPGYWKNHPEAWVTLTPNDPIHVFTFPSAVFFLFDGDTYGEALSYKGGSDIDGAIRILLRAAVAGILNIRSAEVNYAIDNQDELENLVNEAMATLDRDEILGLASTLDFLNNYYGCPL